MRQKRERERERQKERERERESERARERERQTDRQRDRERQKDKDRDRERQADRNTERETDRDRDQSVASSPWVLCSSVSSTLSGGTKALSETPPSLHPVSNTSASPNYLLCTTTLTQDGTIDYIQLYSYRTNLPITYNNTQVRHVYCIQEKSENK